MTPSSGKRIIDYLRILIGLGVTMIVVNIAFLSWSLSHFRNERDRTLKEQATVSSLLSSVEVLSSQSKIDLQKVILESSTDPDLEKASSSPEKFQQTIHQQLATISNNNIKQILTQLDALSEELLIIADRARVWRVNYNAVESDLFHETTINLIRDRIDKLINTVDLQDGKLHLQEALLYKKIRNEKNSELFEKLKKSSDQLREYEVLVADLKRDFYEFSKTLEMLNGEDSYDHLANMKENILTPILDHIEYALGGLDIGEKMNDPILSKEYIDQIRALLFGEEETKVQLPQNLDVYRAGFYNLRKSILQSRLDSGMLLKDLNSTFDKIEDLHKALADLPIAQNSTFSQLIEESLTRNFKRILIIGFSCIILFLWLGWLISRQIKTQVNEIEKARLEAEESHESTQKLLSEKEKSSKELEAAHKELQANEQRYRQLSASAPIGIFEITTDGTCLYTNPQWQKITGYSLGQSFGTGWLNAVHPADMEKFSKWKNSITENTDFELEFRIKKSSGETVWTHTYITAICSITGSIIGYVGTIEDISERKKAAEELDKANKKLVDISRQAGMAEIATDVLHNIGNVLNSVNVSLTLVVDRLKKSKLSNLTKLNSMLQERLSDIGEFISNDPKGKQIPAYLNQLTEHLTNEQATTLEEVKQLEKNVDHIKDIVTMQQNYAKVSGVTEIVKPVDVFEDALHMHLSSLTRHDIEITKKYDDVPSITADKHKILQILVNLIANAKHACDEGRDPKKKIILRVTTQDDRLFMSVEDNGIGIKPEYASRIFAHGFTTRKHGHGFGLHSGALSAKEMGGSLTVKSDGEGMGATFTLDLPLKISAPTPMPL